MKKIKILFYNGQLFMGGIERVAVSYINELAKDRNVELTVLIKENDREKNVFFKEISKNVDIKFIKTREMVKYREKISQKKSNLFWKLVYVCVITYERIYMRNWLKKFNEKNKFDVIIDFDMSLGKYIEVLDGFKLGWVHYSLKFKKQKKRKSKRFKKRLAKYDKIITICDEMKEEAINLFDLSNNQVERLYNPFNIEKIQEKLKEKDLTLEQENMLNKKYMIGVSRLEKGKGRLELIEIYYNLKEKYDIKEKLYLLGDGKEKEELQEKISELGLENSVFLLGQIQNPYIWMKKAEVFLHPSYGEGLPTVFLESIICGTPVIAYDCPTGPKDILGNSQYGYLVEIGNKENFESAIKEFLDNKEEGQARVKKFFKEKLDEFRSETVLKKLKNIIKNK